MKLGIGTPRHEIEKPPQLPTKPLRSNRLPPSHHPESTSSECPKRRMCPGIRIVIGKVESRPCLLFNAVCSRCRRSCKASATSSTRYAISMTPQRLSRQRLECHPPRPNALIGCSTTSPPRGKAAGCITTLCDLVEKNATPLGGEDKDAIRKAFRPKRPRLLRLLLADGLQRRLVIPARLMDACA